MSMKPPDFDTFIWSMREMHIAIEQLKDDGHSEESAELSTMATSVALRLAHTADPHQALRRFTEMLEKSLSIWIEKMKEKSKQGGLS
jgi:hypothetical protein